MSSSPRQSPSLQGAAQASPPSPASPFPYSEVTVLPGQRGSPLTGFSLSGGEKAESVPQAVAYDAEREAQARALGRQQGELESRAKYEEQSILERSAIAMALTDFSRERAAYYQKVEEEAVRLALSIARKILHREAQVDPLLLMGVVRVALERLEGATGVVLAVHPQRAADWRAYLASHVDAGSLPEVAEDPAMLVERCQLRTSMGSADLGLELQLKEIEQGLMDLLAARPKEKP
jgi:flagellar assembly protein FliH